MADENQPAAGEHPPVQVAPYGSWRSPITADLVVAGSRGLGSIALDGETIYWSEGRPSEGGRTVVVRRTPDGRIDDVTPPPYNVRSRVHEYGGGAYTVANGTVYFSNFADNRLYWQRDGAAPAPLTPEGATRYADLVADARRNRLICVREDHGTAVHEPVNTLVAVSLDGGDAGTVLAEGADFYSSPRLSPDGTRLAWLSWNHPNMPWDGTDLWLAEIADDGTLANARTVAGGLQESIFQPEWSPDGTLTYVSDRTGWWNLYRRQDNADEALCPMEAEFGLPHWVFGLSTYGFASADEIICAYAQGGRWYLARLDTRTKRLSRIDLPYTEIEGVRVGPGFVVFLGGSPTMSYSIVRLDLATGQTETLRRSNETALDPGYLSIPEEIAFPTEGGRHAYGFFYPPRHKDYTAPPGEKPPLRVLSHGGPTGATDTVLSLSIQYWTSRGFAVLDVNYGGSTGYGRPYRERLNGRWGVVDVDDCVNGARYLAAQGKVDPDRLIIRGGSAGGYTTLAALTFRDVFKAGASYYGIGDLEALQRDTHKFESRYNDRLIGPYPERRDLYVERSPIHHVERLSAPVIFLQGLDDRVVPPNQAETMVEALRRRGIPVAYLQFEGEGHGFRRAGTLKRALEAELYFYARVFGFTLADPVEPIEIENLPPEPVA